jgi:Domain of unknown function (DUF4352)
MDEPSEAWTSSPTLEKAVRAGRLTAGRGILGISGGPGLLVPTSRSDGPVRGVMSDVSRGSGWWQAPDGYGYLPFTRESGRAWSGPTPPLAGPAARMAPVSPPIPGWWHYREATLAFLAAALVAVALIVGLAGSSAGQPTRRSVHLGQVISDGGMVFRVAGVTCGLTHLGTRYFGATAPNGGQWCVASVGVANTTATSQGFAAWDQYAVDSSGKTLSVDTSAITYLAGDGQALYADLNPGAVIGVRIPFELPRSAHIVAFELQDSAISTAVTVENKH